MYLNMLYDIKDRVYCKVSGANIVVRTSQNFDIILDFEIIGFAPDNTYVVYIPTYYNIKERFMMSETQLNEYNVDKKFLNKNGYIVTVNEISKIKKASCGSDGMFCLKCKQFYQFSEPNQLDGTMICYSCRSNPY